ncbi:hypothetical protein [Streptomyces spectabilis]|uniref:hypothetical protein n=1 Tax=Streptomyces spectabilis TaxID=68270 RepID=UPI001CEF5F71|nr:hypothetical protein [Streptomyces spectabilis]
MIAAIRVIVPDSQRRVLALVRPDPDQAVVMDPVGVSAETGLADVVTLQRRRQARILVHDEESFFLDTLSEYQWARDAAGLAPATLDSADWTSYRRQRWPASLNPHLLVSQKSAADPGHPAVSSAILSRALPRGLTPSGLRQDRISLNEAAESTDPLRLMRLFGITDEDCHALHRHRTPRTHVETAEVRRLAQRGVSALVGRTLLTVFSRRGEGGRQRGFRGSARTSRRSRTSTVRCARAMGLFPPVHGLGPGNHVRLEQG